MSEAALKPRTVRATGLVQAVETVTPHMRRITLGGGDIAGFLCTEGADAPAAWVKLSLPSGEGRAYTLRRTDRERAMLHRPLPPGPGYMWLAGESGAVRTLKRHYLDERALPPDRVSAKGYWKPGTVDYRDAG